MPPRVCTPLVAAESARVLSRLARYAPHERIGDIPMVSVRRFETGGAVLLAERREHSAYAKTPLPGISRDPALGEDRVRAGEHVVAEGVARFKAVYIANAVVRDAVSARDGNHRAVEMYVQSKCSRRGLARMSRVRGRRGSNVAAGARTVGGGAGTLTGLLGWVSVGFGHSASSEGRSCSERE